jgi:glycosyltransferase involved in cell wall biosynthesis
MNILHLTPYYAPAWAFGGVVRAVTGLAEAQARAGHRVVVLTADALDRSRSIGATEEVRNGVRIHRARNLIPLLRRRWNLSTPIGVGRTAARLIRRHGFDVLHCHELRTTENLLAAGRACPPDLPRIVSPHGTLPVATGRRWAKRVWDGLFGAALARRMSHVLALTDGEAEEARALWRRLGAPLLERQVTVVPNGVEDFDAPDGLEGAAFRSRWNLGEEPVVLYLGRLAERKRIPLLVSAFARVLDRGARARLVVAGPDEGAEAALRRMVCAFSLEGRVTFTGLLEGKDRIAALRSADVFVLPAAGEGASIAALEAAACGLPLILTEVGIVPEEVEAESAMVVGPMVEDMANAMRRLLDDRPLRERMGRRGRELVGAEYTWTRIAARVVGVYQEVIRRAGRAGP